MSHANIPGTVISLCNERFGAQEMSLYQIILTHRCLCSQTAVISHQLHCPVLRMSLHRVSLQTEDTVDAEAGSTVQL